METQTRERVDKYWHGMFGPGKNTVVVEHGAILAAYPGVFCVLRDQTAFVSAPPELVRTVTDWHPTAETVMDAQWWREHLPGWLVVGPGVHSILDRVDGLGVALGNGVVRAAAPEDLAQLRERVTEAEWVESGFAGDDVVRAWVVLDQDGRAMAGANLTPYDGMPADVGVLADPTARGRGNGTAVAAVAARYAVENHGIARWRAKQTNRSSRRLAEKLGFEDDCLQLAVRPE